MTKPIFLALCLIILATCVPTWNSQGELYRCTNNNAQNSFVHNKDSDIVLNDALTFVGSNVVIKKVGDSPAQYSTLYANYFINTVLGTYSLRAQFLQSTNRQQLALQAAIAQGQTYIASSGRIVVTRSPSNLNFYVADLATTGSQTISKKFSIPNTDPIYSHQFVNIHHSYTQDDWFIHTWDTSGTNPEAKIYLCQTSCQINKKLVPDAGTKSNENYFSQYGLLHISSTFQQINFYKNPSSGQSLQLYAPFTSQFATSLNALTNKMFQKVFVMRKYDGFFAAMSDDQHSISLIFTVSLNTLINQPLPTVSIQRQSSTLPDNFKQLTDGKTGFVQLDKQLKQPYFYILDQNSRGSVTGAFPISAHNVLSGDDLTELCTDITEGIKITFSLIGTVNAGSTYQPVVFFHILKADSISKYSIDIRAPNIGPASYTFNKFYEIQVGTAIADLINPQIPTSYLFSISVKCSGSSALISSFICFSSTDECTFTIQNIQTDYTAPQE